MILRDLLQFSNAEICDIALIKTVNGPKAVLHLSAPMTKEAAKALKLDYVYTNGGGVIPREGLDGLSLDYELTDQELSIPTSLEKGVFTTLYPDLIHKFKLARIEDAQFELSLRAHITGALGEVLDFFVSQNKQTFEFAIRPRQGELFEGGTRVEMTSEKPEGKKGEKAQKGKPVVDHVFACALCARDVPLTQDGTAHVDTVTGEVTDCVHPSAIAAKAKLASQAAV